VYNLALETKIRAYKEHGVKLSEFDLCYQLVELKEAYPWVGDVDSQAIKASIKKMDNSFKNFFRGKGYPRFKKKSGKQSFTCPNNKREINWGNSTLTIPKIKDIPIVLSRKFEGKIKTVTISKTPTGKYFASVMVDDGKELPVKPPVTEDRTIGIDLGIADVAIFDNGDKVANPKYLRNNLKRLQVLQRRASRKKKGSNNRKKANKRVARQHEKISNQRKDFLQKLSTKIVCDNQATTICVESLSVANMVKNHKLAQAISDVSWSEFVRMLRYKCDWYGKNLIEIGRFETSSKTCSNCGHKKEELSLSERVWACDNCHAIHDRDINAAKNIKSIGLQTGAGSSGEPVESRTKVRAKKQEYMLG
jgi:putative transposase